MGTRLFLRNHDHLSGSIEPAAVWLQSQKPCDPGELVTRIGNQVIVFEMEQAITEFIAVDRDFIHTEQPLAEPAFSIIRDPVYFVIDITAFDGEVTKHPPFDIVQSPPQIVTVATGNGIRLSRYRLDGCGNAPPVTNDVDEPCRRIERRQKTESERVLRALVEEKVRLGTKHASKSTDRSVGEIARLQERTPGLEPIAVPQVGSFVYHGPPALRLVQVCDIGVGRQEIAEDARSGPSASKKEDALELLAAGEPNRRFRKVISCACIFT